MMTQTHRRRRSYSDTSDYKRLDNNDFTPLESKE
jgi:hypothetical protein